VVQQELVSIARAIANNPQVLLADEPTGNLDRKNAFAIMDLLSSVRDTFGTTVIVVTHDAELAARADREVKLQDGEIV
jgi:ABC-type lipoprotein export system ATPase subunit